MSAPSAKIQVCVADKSVWIRVVGRANFASSVDFKTLVTELQQRGCERFALDLTECILMDSTFLGVLAGFGRRLNGNADESAQPVELLNPNSRVAELLANLGVGHIFRIVSGPPYTPPAPTTDALSTTPDAETLARTSLEAHKTLMEIDPENVPKFKEVTQFLAEDLQRMKAKS